MSDPISRLIEAMQRMQASFSKLARDPKVLPNDREVNSAYVSLLSDLIRLAAEIRAGDGERGRLPGGGYQPRATIGEPVPPQGGSGVWEPKK